MTEMRVWTTDERPRVLVVDDDNAILASITALLNASGYDAEATSGDNFVVDLFKARRPDLLLTDIYMPEFDGLELIMAARKALPVFPIIAMTGGVPVDEHDILEVALKLGADAIIRKPFRGEELLALIDRTIGSWIEPKTAATSELLAFGHLSMPTELPRTPS